jgi:hypothetical protein
VPKTENLVGNIQVVLGVPLNVNKENWVDLKTNPFDIFPTRCNVTQFIYFWTTALHVACGFSTHHQEHKTVSTASGIVTQ